MAATPEIYEDKLQRFSRHVSQQACAQRDEIRGRLRQQRDDILAQTKKRCKLEASEQLEKAQAMLARETNEALSRTQLDAKKALTLHRTQIMQDVFENVRGKLRGFQKGATYYPWLLATAKAAIQQLGAGQLEITVGTADAAHARQLESDCGVPVKLADSGTELFGGVRVVNLTANTVCTDTFDDRLEALKSEFLRISGITV